MITFSGTRWNESRIRYDSHKNQGFKIWGELPSYFPGIWPFLFDKIVIKNKLVVQYMSIVSLPTLLQCHDSLLVLVLEKDIVNAIVIVLPYLTDTQRQATQATRK